MENMNLQERLKIGAAYSLFKVIDAANTVVQETRHTIYHVRNVLDIHISEHPKVPKELFDLTGTKHQKIKDMRDSSFYYYIGR